MKGEVHIVSKHRFRHGWLLGRREPTLAPLKRDTLVQLAPLLAETSTSAISTLLNWNHVSNDSVTVVAPTALKDGEIRLSSWVRKSPSKSLSMISTGAVIPEGIVRAPGFVVVHC